MLLVAVAPLLVIGLGRPLHDGLFHQRWCEEVVNQVGEDAGYPHWLAGMNGGLGSPAMFFYPALPYAVPVFVNALPGGATLSPAHLLALGAVVALSIAGFGMWRLLRQFVRPTPALIGAVVYVSAPYFLGTDLYVRGAYAEYWAFAWMPLVLLGVVKIRRSGGGQVGSMSGNAVAHSDGSFPLTSAFAPKLRRDTPALSLGEREVHVPSPCVSENRKGDIPVASSRAWATGMSPLRCLGGVLLLAAGYGALVAIHLPTTLVFSMVPLAFAAVPVNDEWSELSWSRWCPLALTIGGMTLGIGLAAPYFIPAMAMQKYVTLEALTSFHKYNHNFFFGELGWGRFDLGHEFKQTLYLPFLATAVMGVMGFLLARSGERTRPACCGAVPATPHTAERESAAGESAESQRVSGVTPDTARGTRALPGDGVIPAERHSLGWFLLAVLGASVFMMLPWSDFVWRLFPKLQIIQFPWRICSVLTLAAAVLVALGFDAIRLPLTRRSMVLCYFLFVAVAGGLAYTCDAIWRFVQTAPRGDIGGRGYQMEVPEYRPRSAIQPLIETVRSVHQSPAMIAKECGTTNGVAWVEKAGNPDDPLIGARFVQGQGDVAILRWKPRHLLLKTSTRVPAALRVSQLWFPGWTASSKGRELPLRPSKPAGLLEIDVPAGPAEIAVDLKPLWPEKVGNRLGLVSASVWLIGLLGLRVNRYRGGTGKRGTVGMA